MKKMTNTEFTSRFKNGLNDLYVELEGKTANLRLDKDEYSPFVTQWGDLYPSLGHAQRIMFYGRATNGWGNEEWLLYEHLGDGQKYIDQRLKWVQDYIDNPDSEYNPNRSQFWKVIMGVTKSLLGGNEDIETDWWRYIVWGNLCKIAPGKSGNPSQKDYNLTFEVNKKIFDKEIELFDPAIVVMLVGENWAKDFIGPLSSLKKLGQINWDKGVKNRELSIYQKGGRIYVVSLHPQGKKVLPHILGIIQAIMNVSPENFKNSSSGVAALLSLNYRLKAKLGVRIEESFAESTPYFCIPLESNPLNIKHITVQTSFSGKPYFGINFDKSDSSKQYKLIKDRLSPFFEKIFGRLQNEDEYWPVWEYVDKTEDAVKHIESFIKFIKDVK